MARDPEALADRLTVERERRYTMFVVDDNPLGWAVRHWHHPYVDRVGFFPDEDSAWGVVSLILQQVNERGWSDDDAIGWAMNVYKVCRNGIYSPDVIWTIDLDDDSRRAQDHAAEMRVWA